LLTVQELENAVAKGLGRAVIHLRQNDPAPYFHSLRRAAIRWQGEDHWFEEKRGHYLYRLLEHNPRREEIFELVYRQLPRAKGPTPNRTQKERLVLEIARHGSERAREVLYRVFDESGPEFIGSDEIIDLDKFAGFRYVLDHLKDSLLIADDYQLARWRSELEESVGEVEARAWFTTPEAETYRLIYQAREARNESERRARKKEVTPPIPFSRWKSEWEAGGKRRVWNAPSLARENLIKAAEDFQTSEDVEWLFALSRILSFERWFLGDIGVVIDRAKHYFAAEWDAQFPDRGNPFISVLENQRDPRIRDYGLLLLDVPHAVQFAMALLKLNLQAGDEERIERALDPVMDRDHWHRIGMDIIGMGRKGGCLNEEGTWFDLRKLLVRMVEMTPCSFCREGFVRRLIERKEASRQLLEECLEDSASDIRAMANEALGVN
jgi:hypothetical protein